MWGRFYLANHIQLPHTGSILASGFWRIIRVTSKRSLSRISTRGTYTPESLVFSLRVKL